MVDIKKIVEKIRSAVYGLDVRESIAQGIEGIAENEEQHKIETDKKLLDHEVKTDGQITTQNERIDALSEKYQGVIDSNAENPNMIEVVEARQSISGEYHANLKERIDDVEEGAIDRDIIIGSEKHRKFMSLDNDGEVVAHIDKNGASFTELTIDKLNCDGVISVGESKSQTYEITQGDNIQQIIDEIPKYLQGNITLNIAGVHFEDINIHGFMGIGEILFNILEGAELHGSIYINSTTTCVTISSVDQKGKIIHDSIRESAIRVLTSPYVVVQRLNIVASSTSSKNAVYSSYGSSVRVAECKIDKFLQYAFYSNQCSRIHAYNNTGDGNAKTYYATGGATLFLQGTTPSSKTPGTSTIAGQVIGTEQSQGNSEELPPTIESTKVKNYGCLALKSYRGIDGWKTGKAYQGKFTASNPSTYNYYGLYVLGDTVINQIKADLNGRTIKGVKLSIARDTSGGTDTAGVSINLYGTTSVGTGSTPALTKAYKTNIGAIKKGQKYNVTLPQTIIADIINNSIKSIMIHKPDQTNYSIFSSAFNIEVTYV